MSMIMVENLTFSYPSSYDIIFNNVTFQIDTDWKLGFVGRNGRGKTTFFNLLLEKYEYSGRIISSVQFDCFPYTISDKKQMTRCILHEVCPIAEDWELMRELSYLDINADVLWRSFDTLSNGEQTKVLLAALFLNEGHFLLIDEPTNHLDTITRKKVASYLKKKKGFILVSHDRCFLDGCVDHILSLNRANIEVQSGSFSAWFTNFQRQQEFELAQNMKLNKEIVRMNKAVRQSKSWSDAVEKRKNGTRISGIKADKGYIGHKSAKMMKRSKVIESRQQQVAEEKSKLLKNTEYIEGLKIYPMEYYTDLLVLFRDVSVIYGNMQICKPISFEIHQGDRVVLDGKNGSGKSSLLKLLLNNPIEYTGTITIASGLMISYVPQDTSHLSGTLSEFAKKSNIDESLFKAILRKMDFERIQFEKEIRDFSEGQKKKVLIAKSLCEKAHLYVWDEPLNFIDLYSRLQIEQLIREFRPTMLLVEHDSAFRDAIATKVVSL